MTTYESDIKSINASSEIMFNTLSDLKQLRTIDMSSLEESGQIDFFLKNAEFTDDTCFVNVKSMGRIGLRVLDRDPIKTIKYKVENLPVAANAWIQLKELSPNDTRMKLTVKADIPPMLKMMVDKKINKGIQTVAENIVKIFDGKKA